VVRQAADALDAARQFGVIASRTAGVEAERAQKAEAERDALRAKLDAVRALCDERDQAFRDSGVPGSKAIESAIASGAAQVNTVAVRAALDGPTP
jgi:hypothetical protein